MNGFRRFAVCCLFVAWSLTDLKQALSAASPSHSGQAQHAKTDSGTPFRPPTFELKGKLAKIFAIIDCEYISGMTCRLHYNGALPLPSRVFFTEFDQNGRQAGTRVRLIYPKLEPGEDGRATFRIHFSQPTKVVLQGEWKGPWQDPY